MAVSQAIAALGVLDVRALRRQLAILEKRLQIVETEATALSAQRAACALLLQQASAQDTTGTIVVAPPPLAALGMLGGAPAVPVSLSEAIRRLLAPQSGGLTADEIFDELKRRGFELPRHRPVKEVYATLENDERFLETGEGRWVLVAEGAGAR